MVPADLPRSLRDALLASAPASRRALAGRLRAFSAARLAVTIFLGGSASATLRPAPLVPDERRHEIRAREDAA